MQTKGTLVWAFIGSSLSFCVFSAHGASAESILFDIHSVEARDAKLRVFDRAEGLALRIATGHTEDWPGITLKSPQGYWNLSAYEYLALDVKNVGSRFVDVFCRVDNPGADGVKNCVTAQIGLKPEEKKTLQVPLKRRLPERFASKLFGMRGYPGGMSKENGIDAKGINQLIVFVSRPAEEHEFEISNIRAGGSYTPPEWLRIDEDEFFPLIDEYGQFIHQDWPGKTSSAQSLDRHRDEEAVDLTKHPGPDGWNRYGGWETGPALTATGYFRVEKYQDKWWLVDPEGRLFWSHGIDCVSDTTGTTPITDRKHWFLALPDASSPFARFYGQGTWAPHGYYQDKRYETYNFTGANLLRKDGQNWAATFAEITHRRLSQMESICLPALASGSETERLACEVLMSLKKEYLMLRTGML